MWKDATKKRYYWHAIGEDFTKLLEELVDAEQEEESDLFRFDLHMRSAKDLAVFNKVERNEIKRLFSILIKDTKRHSRCMARISKLLESYKKEFEE